MVDEAPANDRELLEAWAAGDKLAGDAFVERHFDGLYRFFANHLRNDIADLVQRTFLVCIDKRERFPEHVSVRAFLYGIAHKELLMATRKHARGRQALQMVAGGASPVTSPSALVALREEERLLAAAVQRLPFELQVLIELFYWEELSVGELATVLELPEGTVKSRLHRARQLLREEMEAGGAALTLVETTMSSLDRWAVALREQWDRKRDADPDTAEE